MPTDWLRSQGRALQVGDAAADTFTRLFDLIMQGAANNIEFPKFGIIIIDVSAVIQDLARCVQCCFQSARFEVPA